jgi:NADPH:quinone reductase-like Zn-dependent oxidoreductase
MSQRAAILPSSRSRLTLIHRPIPAPHSNQILVRNHAIAANPLDWKIQEHNIFIKNFPWVLGTDVAGIVTAIGPEVTHFKIGDRVTGMGVSFSWDDIDRGAFQEYTILDEHCAAKVPGDMGFEEAATVPMSVATAAVGIFDSMKIPREGKQQGIFLVSGGASSVGLSVIQIASSLGFTVFTTASRGNHDALKWIGAYQAFDYSDEDVVEKILEAIRGSGMELRYTYDAIAEKASQHIVGTVIHTLGGGKVLLTLGPSPELLAFGDVQWLKMNADACSKNKELGSFVFHDWLEPRLVEKRYVPNIGIHVNPDGLEGIQTVLDLVRGGLKAKKAVVTNV